MRVEVFENKIEVAKQFSKFFTEQINNSDVYHVALSGGSTPKIVFDVLAEEYGDTVDWQKVHFYWGDERCVPSTDDQSNYKMTVEHLFSKIDVPEENIHRVLGEASPEREVMRYANLLEINLDRVEEVPQFDLIILGMGDDGHTASIFPHQIELWDANDHCVVAEHPETGQKRITINGKVINAAKQVIFLVTGKAKAEKVKEIHNQVDGFKNYPAALVSPKSKDLIWFLDDEAASFL
ncbi:6-phosphogluconolactonase [Croceivirga lutea]|uniref:6-phosphogluconolactonase n=1 Tax=Croceivirga lutea TaxID=1775167 RepID=UPI0016399E33|nr:6-phosphogluconolactonase [Croceivirga lutea]GGG47529.1 6-phosphogluconolactonase [Croceivirga lutea]